MELNPHDLLEIESAKELTSLSDIPEWVKSSIAEAPFVVVRRARASEGWIAVGIRGKERNERFAAFVPVDRILRRITPEQLTRERKWNGKSKEIFRGLEEIGKVLDYHSLEWGPTGSIGFELASGKETTKKTSDIDIVIRFSKNFTLNFARMIEAELKNNQFRVDIQIETSEGAFLLNEYLASGEKPILLRTVDGPRLKNIVIKE
ncbi:malonate decarboxylase holo-ACP synthase [Planococcus sp. CPCC 101016]|uniref:malonate decarboxylase holo-ACP synthase n=1 Tax=Planococcus sp. CPCC 101016 TaxID=2599617 RepID=UPI0011B7D123|nr:malonate decarboxylase holo-ACP synthase [Planococcus sp. CPCC 101016]TWT08032.1 malonate decarboxylase holo-ACP synthase [Planococcus sp. CPCC 101016]